MKQQGFKQPINARNFETIKDKLYESKIYIKSLKSMDGELLVDSRRKTGFVGFLICIQSALTLYHEWCEKEKCLIYLPFYKISQDHIELLFGCLRRHGGGNNNPTIRQFKAAMKKIIIHAGTRTSKTGNCMPLEEISILHVSSANKIQQSEHIINCTSRLSEVNDTSAVNDTDNVDMADNSKSMDLDIEINIPISMAEKQYNFSAFLNDHAYLCDIREISQFSNNIIEYIAGYVIKQLKISLRCEDCINVLIGERNTNNLIGRKTR